MDANQTQLTLPTFLFSRYDFNHLVIMMTMFMAQLHAMCYFDSCPKMCIKWMKRGKMYIHKVLKLFLKSHLFLLIMASGYLHFDYY